MSLHWVRIQPPDLLSHRAREGRIALFTLPSDQVVDNLWLSQRACIADGVDFVGGYFPENSAHDFAGAGFG